MIRSTSTSVPHNEDSKMNIKDIYPQLTSFNLTVIVLQTAPNSYMTKDGNEVKTCKIADQTGSVNLSVWGENCSVIQPGDILQLTRCYASLFKGCLTVYVGKFGAIRKINEFCMLFSETPDMSEVNPEWVKQFYDSKTNSTALQQNKATNSYKTQPARNKRDKPTDV